MTANMRENPFAAERVAATYDAWFDTPLGSLVDALELDLLLRYARPSKGERVLDVGTGTGHLAVRLARLGLTVDACDASEAMLAQARLASETIRWRRAVAEALPYDDGAFDLVTSLAALEFMADPAAAVREMVRVARPKGRIVLGTINAEGRWASLYRALAKDPTNPMSAARFLDGDHLLALLAPYGHVSLNSAAHIGPEAKTSWLAWPREWWGRAFCRRQGALLVARVDLP